MGIKRLSDLKPGQSGIFERCTVPKHEGKLLTLGFVSKAQLTLVRKAPFGEALYIKVNDHMVALRYNEAAAIDVTEKYNG